MRKTVSTSLESESSRPPLLSHTSRSSSTRHRTHKPRLRSATISMMSPSRVQMENEKGALSERTIPLQPLPDEAIECSDRTGPETRDSSVENFGHHSDTPSCDEFVLPEMDNSYSIWSLPDSSSDEERSQRRQQQILDAQARIDDLLRRRDQRVAHTLNDPVVDAVTEKMRQVFDDVLDDHVDMTGEDLVHWIRDRYDAQVMRIRRLERALLEKEAQIRELQFSKATADLAVVKEEKHTPTILDLMHQYPRTMEAFRQHIERQSVAADHEKCRKQLMDQKQAMLQEQQRKFEALRSKYRAGFQEIVDRLLNDPSRLEKEVLHRLRQETAHQLEQNTRYWKQQCDKLQQAMHQHTVSE
ncbi:uncharacterized protein BYT42DRAFT_555440 [Radiomyces spectabilis]|uniref:uncharacterized protein n=1 Tax=Radiomyces spectabilis TaxID=64574 RepID=UPI0022208347|nr:uncharacterized protein BYT42DRAFT_555440 [Radiomyces spectabilis]KAI8391061.1 hypothetical protein BYT42DRAFT_555440 [Radiomyces spectabilis]